MQVPTDDMMFIMQLYCLIAIPTIFCVLQILDIQPLRLYKESGQLNTPVKKGVFYSIRILYNTIGFLGGIMFANTSINILTMLIEHMSVSFVLSAGICVGLIAGLFEYKPNHD